MTWLILLISYDRDVVSVAKRAIMSRSRSCLGQNAQRLGLVSVSASHLGFRTIPGGSRPPTTWIHQICRDMDVTATEALQLAEDRPFWRTIATAGGFG